MAQLKAIAMIVVGLVVVILIIQNNDAMNTTVQLRMNPVFWPEMSTGKVSLYQIVLIVFFLGVLSTGIYGMVERFQLKRRVRMLTRELEARDNELISLRNQPTSADDIKPVQAEST